MPGAITELALKPGLPTSHYSRHVKKLLGMDTDSELLQYIEAPCSHGVDGSRTSTPLAVIHPHEALHKEVIEHPELHVALAEEAKSDRLPH